MITVSITSRKEDKKTKKIVSVTEIKCYKNPQKFKSEVLPIIIEERKAKEENREPKQFVFGVSYDTKSEREMLIETGVLVTEVNDPIIGM